MTKSLLPILAGFFLLAGCARNYTIVKTSGEHVTAHGKPKYANGYYYYTDATGHKTRVFASRVREIAPANMVSDPAAGFQTK